MISLLILVDTSLQAGSGRAGSYLHGMMVVVRPPFSLFLEFTHHGLRSPAGEMDE
jgi:hypothetical protein